MGWPDNKWDLPSGALGNRSCRMFRTREHYQQHATKLWKITRNCKDMYWWFIQPTIGQNCRAVRFYEWSVEGNWKIKYQHWKKKIHTIQALNCTEGYCFFTLMVTSFKGLPKLQDGISTLGLTTYGRRYMEATMVLYFNFSRWPYHSRCTTLISYFCLWSYDIVIFGRLAMGAMQYI